MTVYDFLIEKIKRGVCFNINLAERSLSVDGRYVIRNGKQLRRVSGLELGINKIEPISKILELIDVLYESFYNSTPSDISERNQGRYFRARDKNDMSTDDLSAGEFRHVARFRLEFFILCQLLYGSFVWDTSVFRSWFWRSSVNPTLVLRRQSLGL